MAPPRRAQSQRPPLREEPLSADAERAALRAAELLDGGLDIDTVNSDEFYIDPAVIPDDWTYEWKMRTVFGQPNPSYDIDVHRMGWRCVPAERHPEMMPVDWSGADIERKGLVLMERPVVITQMVRRRDDQAARALVHQKEQSLSEAPEGAFDRVDVNRRSTVRLKKSMERVEIPE